MITVRVPATSANIGPGFDCMGLALDAYAYVHFERIEEGLRISGCPPRWQNENNLVYQSFCRVFAHLHRPVPPIKITIEAGIIPDARGLGSSAVCIVAGALAANALCDHHLSKKELLTLCTAMEGHPDNVAPALYGGLCISFMSGEQVFTARYDVSSQYRFVAMIPDYPILTEDARRVLPHTLPFEDAVFNLGRCAALAKALSEGDHTLLTHACEDRLHQPYRKVLFPQYDEIDALCQTHHVLAWYISGSGSTMMAVSEKQDVGEALAQAVLTQYPTWQCTILHADAQGAVIEEHHHG